MARSSTMFLVLAGLSALAIMIRPAFGQMDWPMQGQNYPPPGVTGINVDIVVDSFRAINSHANSWNAVHWVHLSWVDERAAPAIQASTQAWRDAANSSGTGYVAAGSCKTFCHSSKDPAAGCCDQVWLPHLEANNLVGITQEAVYRWHIWVDTNVSTATMTPPPAVAGAPPAVFDTSAPIPAAGGKVVHWVTRITAEWMSPFDFRAWPFEHQHLLMELQIGSSIADRAYLVLRHAAVVSNTPTSKGDALPGWHVAKITKRVYDNSGCFGTTNTTSIYSISDNPQQVNIKPLSPWSWAQVQNKQPNTSAVTSIATTACDPASFVSAEVAQYGPQQIVMDVMVRRTQIYYILSTILPLLLLDYMVFITYAMERSDLESRMGVVVTLVLAISALQFTYDFPPASYLNAVQQITLTSYVLYFIVAVESMVAAHICRLHSRKRAFETMAALAAQRNGSMQRPETSLESRASLDGAVVLGLAAPVPPSPRTSLSPCDNINTSYGGLGRFKRGVSQSDAGAGRSVFSGPPTAQPSRAVTPRTSMAYDVNDDPEPSAHMPASVDALNHTSITMPNSRRGRTGPVAEALEMGRGTDSETETASRFKPGCMRGLGNFGKRGSKSEDRTSCDERTRSGHPEERTKSGVPAAPKRTRSSFEFKRISSSVTSAVTKSRAVQKRIDADEAYAQLIAARMDRWFSWILLVSFTVVVAVLLYVNQQVGDHKLMMGGDAPANM